jgi:hypothetical protein
MIQLNDTTYSIPGLGDRLTEPVITIGGKDAKKFAPNLNIGYDFGGGEEYFDNLNRTDKIITGKSEIKHDGKRVSIIEGSDIDEIYTDDQGRMKWDVVFEKCPESFVLEWRRTCSPGLTAYYQPALTEEEIREGAYRPDDVIGSYAIYCDRAHNWIRPLNRKKEIPDDWQVQRAAGAELGDLNISAYREYKTGKVSHRYRPFVVDADGKTEWCTLLIVGNVERVALPEDFMRSAKYPVTLDPTLGYTSVGASTTSNMYYIFICNNNNTAASNGTASKVYAYVSGGSNLYLGYYSDISSLPATLIDSDVIETPPASAAWASVDVTGSIASGTKYSPALHANSDSTVLYTDFGGYGTATRAFFRSAAGFESSISSTDAWHYYYSCYIEYTESGGATGHPTASRFRGIDRNNNVRYA